MARCPGATDLVASNPALAFALASNWVFHTPSVTQPLRAARSLITKKQSEIQAWLGFPPSETVRRILGKIDPSALTARKLLHFQWRMTEQREPRVLSHLPIITADMFRFLCDRDGLTRLSPRALHQIAEMGGGVVKAKTDFYSLWLDGKRFAEQLGLALPERLASISQIVRWHDEMSDRVQNRNHDHIKSLTFGSVPFPGDQNIRPIMTGAELLEEGEVMHHCVANRFQRVSNGGCFIYRVEQPIRATLSIARSSQGWEVEEFRGRFNNPISASIEQQVARNLFGHGDFAE